MNGLIYAHLISNQETKELHGLTEVDNVELKEADILWVHLDSTSDEAIMWLKEEQHLPTIVIDALISENTRPRYVKFKEGTLFTFRGLNLNPDSDIDDMVHLNIWIETNRIITFRSEKVYTTDAIHEQLQGCKGPETKADFLIEIIKGLTKRMTDYTSKLSDVIDGLEDNLLNNNLNLRKTLANVRRETLLIRRYIVPQRDLLMVFYMEKLDWLSEDHRPYFRELSEHVARLVEELDAIRDRAAIISEEISNLRSEEMNRTMYILALVGGIFLPLSFFTGLFGINIAGMPGVSNNNAFIIFSIAMLFIALLEYLIFKWNKWL